MSSSSSGTPAAKTERVDRGEIRRTGWITDARRCPKHDEPLELCFDEADYSTWSPRTAFDHDDNRVRWRCESCGGAWLENVFIDSYSPEHEPDRLRLQCPICSGRRVTHECVPACCERHACVDCGAALSLQVELIQHGSQPSDDATWDGRGFYGGVFLERKGPPEPRYRSSWTRSFRQCSLHDLALELVFVAVDEEPPRLLAWYCAECACAWTETQFRRAHWRFVPDATPGALCPSCHDQVTYTESRGDCTAALAASDSDGLVRCPSCSAALRLTLYPR